jgi:hypothetical protein
MTIKCSFCGWSTPDEAVNGKGYKLPGYEALQSHVNQKHPGWWMATRRQRREQGQYLSAAIEQANGW